MTDIPTTHRRSRIHRKRLRDPYPGVARHIEQLPQLRLLRVIRTCWIPWRRANATILFLDELLVGERLLPVVPPELAAHTLVEMLSAGPCQAIRQRLQHDARVVIMCLFESRHVLLDTNPSGDRERAKVVTHAAGLRGNVIRQALVRLSRSLALLLPQEGQPHCNFSARLIRVDFDVIPD